MFQSSHTHGPDDVCPTCGQSFPPGYRYGQQYGDRKPNRTGVAIAVGLHLLILALVLMNPSTYIKLTPPSKEGEMVWIAPPAPTPKPAPKPRPAPEKPSPQKPTPPKPVAQTRPRPAPQPRTNPDAITEPRRQETPPVQAKLTPPPPDVTDMSQMIAEARRRRGAVESPPSESAESEDAKAKARAVANIMGAQGRNAAGEMEDSGGIFDVKNVTFNSADLKFRGWSTNFKRRWLSQVRVELGGDIDIENAVVTKMIELIRKEKPGDFEWESHRLGKTVRMSARREDEPQLRAFLIQEMFPKYIRPAGR